jgi:hypothetical protein
MERAAQSFPQIDHSGTNSGTNSGTDSGISTGRGDEFGDFHRLRSKREKRWPSRTKRRERHYRLNAQVLDQVEIWCQAHRLKEQDLIDQLLVIFLDQHAARGLRIDDLIDRSIDDLCAPVENSPVENSTRNGESLINLAGFLSSNEAQKKATYTTAQTEKPVDRNEKANGELQRANEILALYGALTGNRIRLTDHRAFKTIFDLSDMVICAGIMRAVLKCQRVGSFAYCAKVARQLAELEANDVHREFTELRNALMQRAHAGQLMLPMNTKKLLFGDFH